VACVPPGAAPDTGAAMRHPINAVTAQGRRVVRLAPSRRMPDGPQALDGPILCGLPTAFPCGMVQSMWPRRGR
jgi:hypothetical protein